MLACVWLTRVMPAIFTGNMHPVCGFRSIRFWNLKKVHILYFTTTLVGFLYGFWFWFYSFFLNRMESYR